MLDPTNYKPAFEYSWEDFSGDFEECMGKNPEALRSYFHTQYENPKEVTFKCLRCAAAMAYFTNNQAHFGDFLIKMRDGSAAIDRSLIVGLWRTFSAVPNELLVAELPDISVILHHAENERSRLDGRKK